MNFNPISDGGLRELRKGMETAKTKPSEVEKRAANLWVAKNMPMVLDRLQDAEEKLAKASETVGELEGDLRTARHNNKKKQDQIRALKSDIIYRNKRLKELGHPIKGAVTDETERADDQPGADVAG